jgi:hypothetical protein
MARFHPSRALCVGVLLVGVVSFVPAPAAHAAGGLTADAGDASVIEGNTRARNLYIPITLTAPATQSDVVVKYQILAISATPGVPTKNPAADFNNRNGVEKTLLFKRGANGRTPVKKSVGIPIYPDTNVEGQETFAVQINDVTGGGSGGANIFQTGRLGIGTIVDDDPAGGADVGVGDATLVEGDSGYRGLQFTISLSAPQTADVSVQYDIVSGSASCAPFYYGSPTQPNTDCSSAMNKRVLFKKGANGFTPAFKAVTVQVVGDTTFEGDETFTLHLHDATGLTITRADADGLILEDGD